MRASLRLCSSKIDEKHFTIIGGGGGGGGIFELGCCIGGGLVGVVLTGGKVTGIGGAGCLSR